MDVTLPGMVADIADGFAEIEQLASNDAIIVTDNEQEPITPRRGLLLTKQMCLTAEDLNAQIQNKRENHERSQDILRMVMERRGVFSKTRAPYVRMKTEEDDGQGDTTGNADEEDVQRSELTNRIFGRLRERGIHGIRTLRVMLHNMDTGNEGTMLGRTFEGALTHMGIRLKTSEYEMFVRLFGLPDKDDGEGTQLVDYVRFLGHGVGNWSTERYEVVQEAYEFLCDCCKGSLLTVDVIEKKFNVFALTSALCPGLDQHSSREEFLKQWSDSVLSADGIVTWVDFLDYYLDVSWCFDSHHGFCLYACKSWNIDMDDWIAKKVFRRYATADNEDILQWDEFQIMLQELDPTITADEAKAFFKAIDEDESGEVDLEEFLSSKVLKVKRLFDHYDVDQSRTVDQAEMICILRSLNDSISEREALSLYQYADLDGNGDISFVEFLENNLLKLLAIFEQFDKNRGGDLNEAEMKQLLRKQDPFLDDYDLHQIYRAIDTDGGGSISFIEFCESHVLRAKLLFDRYDIDRGRALTQFKFRELMLDMDGTLSTSQMEAIYHLVADQNSGKVHLGGFLNPNIVKLKLLFDKYDQDRSRYLDSGEFRLMLKDLFKNATDKDVEAIVKQVCPTGTDQGGISFTVYIHRYKDISRKYDLMQLAKRRKARDKAKSKGLVFNNN